MLTPSQFSTALTAAIADPFVHFGILVLLALLIQKELVGGAGNRRLKRLSKGLNIGIIPLLLVFLLVAAFRAAQALH